MSVAWRIDSLDPRAGLAFASFREADLDRADPPLDRDAVFLCPPAFGPEPVRSRAIGLSAARGRAQLGIFVDETELAFESLEALSEFVRRIYVSSGAGDAGGGAGGDGRPRPPAPEGGGFESGGEEEGPHSESGATVIRLAQDASEGSNALSFQAGEPAPTYTLEVGTDWAARGSVDGRHALANGASELVLEFLRRLPKSGRGTAADMARWCEGAGRLGAAIAILDLWPPILFGPRRDGFERITKQIYGNLGLASGETRLILPFLFAGYGINAAASAYGMAMHYTMVMRYLPQPAPSLHLRPGDPVDSLASWPVPDYVALLVDSAQRDVSTLHLLSAASASPLKLAGFRPVHYRAADILLFCVAHLLATAEPVGTNSAFAGDDDVRDAMHSNLARRTLEWVRDQFPRLIFPGQLEQLIADAAKLGHAS